MLKNKLLLLSLILVFINNMPLMAEEISDNVIRQMAADDEIIRICLSKIGLINLRGFLEIRKMSLTRNEGKEFIVDATREPYDGCELCGIRTCDAWIYRQIEQGYKLMLKVNGPEDIIPLNSYSKGYRDLKIIYPGGINYPASYEIYKFDGECYKKWGDLKELSGPPDH